MALAEGQIDDATADARRPLVRGRHVIHGEKRGRRISCYPTANIRLDKNCGLKHGIYAVRVGRGTAKRPSGSRRRRQFRRRSDLRQWRAAAGVFLFDFKGDLYGTPLDVAFIAFIRDE
jgi:riboflavin kinase/FMN adenylyltransferase